MLTSFTPRHLFHTAVDLELWGARALQSSATTDEIRLQWAEHGNRLHAFSLFQLADLSLGGNRRRDLHALLEGTRTFAPYERVWVTEGIGYLWGARLTGPLPGWSVIPLHSGVGLSVARRLLQQPAARRNPDVVSALVRRCAGTAMPGFEQVAIEAIGLAIRNLHPQLASMFDDGLMAADPVLRACFWHGLGRGAYFATSSWQPGDAAAGALADAKRSAPDAQAATNVVAGFAWAATLVNLDTPDVLARYVAELVDDGDAVAFADGITSSLIVWQDAAPDDDRVVALLDYDSTDPCGAALGRFVRGAAEDALGLYPALRAAGRLQNVFHCEAA